VVSEKMRSYFIPSTFYGTAVKNLSSTTESNC